MGYQNPLLDLPEVKQIMDQGRTLSPGEREFLTLIFSAARHGANREVEIAYRRRKGPMVQYWMWVSTYSRHLRHLVKLLDSPDGTRNLTRSTAKASPPKRNG
jgi:hypothetical protein